MTHYARRQFLRNLGIGAASIPFISGLPSLWGDDQSVARKKRVIIMFSPNGTLGEAFWPDQLGPDTPLELKPMLSALEPFHEQILMLKGVDNRIRGDGDKHMRGMSCVLTGTRLNPGNIQGGGTRNPAGWASGLSIDQHIRNYLQSQESTRTRFGSLEFGVAVPDRADPWTRMCYLGDNKPIASISDPNQMFNKLYGGAQDRQNLSSVLNHVRDDLQRVSKKISAIDRAMLEEHLQLVSQLERDIEAAKNQEALVHPEPEVDPKIELTNDNTPEISRVQIDLMVNALANDMTRVATLQYMRSVGQARMRWLDIEEGHHALSHEKDDNLDAQEKLKRINAWFASQLAYLAKRLSETPEPGDAGGTLLDNTQIVWLNELGKGNNHSLEDIPFLLLGGGADFKTNRALEFDHTPHNRLWLSLAHGMGNTDLKTFGAEEHCVDGPLNLS